MFGVMLVGAMVWGAGILSLKGIGSVLLTALGLGFVIFVHELGHFLVAKWCGVRVERFSIGFGPVLWSFMKGETEYAISAIPFGGYVKMLGQDDVDPNQMTSEAIAQDPRSYTAKTVPQRMAIISAGVIMNVITGTLFFAAAVGFGYEQQASIVGKTVPGAPAWVEGLQPGDEITEIDGRPIHNFRQIIMRIALAQESVDIRGKRRDGSEFHIVLKPRKKPGSDQATIGVGPISSLDVLRPGLPGFKFVTPGTPAAAAKPAFESGDAIVSLDGQPVRDFIEYEQVLSARRAEELVYKVRRTPAGSAPQELEIKVGPQPLRTVGFMTDIGQIAAIQKGSPADGKLQVGDKITHLIDADGEHEIGKDIDPLRLPDLLGARHGEKVTLRVRREKPGADATIVEPELTPEERPTWHDIVMPDSPCAAPSIGIAYYVLHTVLKVDPEGPAAGQVNPKDTLVKVTLECDPARPDEKRFGEILGAKDGKFVYEFADDQRNWPLAFRRIQEFPTWKVTLSLRANGALRDVALSPAEAADWHYPDRGLWMQEMRVSTHDASVGQALQHGFQLTKDSVLDTYLTIKRLVTGGIKLKQLAGPITIAQVAYGEASQGFGDLMYFLGLLSINLAVLNFLPIPLLDGGHMVFLTYEGIFRKPASERVQIAATYLGLAFVLSLMLFSLSNDIFHHWLKLY